MRSTPPCGCSRSLLLFRAAVASPSQAPPGLGAAVRWRAGAAAAAPRRSTCGRMWRRRRRAGFSLPGFLPAGSRSHAINAALYCAMSTRPGSLFRDGSCRLPCGIRALRPQSTDLGHCRLRRPIAAGLVDLGIADRASWRACSRCSLPIARPRGARRGAWPAGRRLLAIAGLLRRRGGRCRRAYLLPHRGTQRSAQRRVAGAMGAVALARPDAGDRAACSGSASETSSTSRDSSRRKSCWRCSRRRRARTRTTTTSQLARRAGHRRLCRLRRGSAGSRGRRAARLFGHARRHRAAAHGASVVGIVAFRADLSRRTPAAHRRPRVHVRAAGRRRRRMRVPRPRSKLAPTAGDRRSPRPRADRRACSPWRNSGRDRWRLLLHRVDPSAAGIRAAPPWISATSRSG